MRSELTESLMHSMKQTCKDHGVQVTVHSQDQEEKILPGYDNLQRWKEQIRDTGINKFLIIYLPSSRLYELYLNDVYLIYDTNKAFLRKLQARIEKALQLGDVQTNKIYLVSQDETTGYDTYDSFVVIAESEEIAKHTDPNSGLQIDFDFKYPDDDDERYGYDWAWTNKKDAVKVTYLGEANPELPLGVVCSSFNAG